MGDVDTPAAKVGKARRDTNRGCKGDQDSDGDTGREGNSERDEKEMRLKHPIKAEMVRKKFLVRKSLLGRGVGKIRYWEFKAG